MKQIKRKEYYINNFQINGNISYNFGIQLKRYLEFNFFYGLLDSVNLIQNN